MALSDTSIDDPQIPPRYYGYWEYMHGGFAAITRCVMCGAVGLYEDAHPARPCRQCGGTVQSCGAGRWIPAVRRWSWRKLRFVVVREGFWERRGAGGVRGDHAKEGSK